MCQSRNILGRKRRQRLGALLESRNLMQLSSSASKRLALFALAGLTPSLLFAQSPLVRQAGEYPIIGSLLGDQVFADCAFNQEGGYVVWQDNLADGDGLGISARRLDRNLAGVMSTIRVNEQAQGDQERPQVAMLKGGGAAFTWQSGALGFSKVYARFMAADGTFHTGDLLLSSYAGGGMVDPHAAALADGSAVIVWSSSGQDGSMEGIYGARFSAKGERMGTEFQVSQTTLLNQRSPEVSALTGDQFVVVWVSEKVKAVVESRDLEGNNPEGAAGRIPLYDVSIYGRRFGADGPLSDEFLVSTLPYNAANPSVASDGLGGFLAAWSTHVGPTEVQGVAMSNGWDVFGRAYNADGTPLSSEVRFNERTFGDQYAPQLTATSAGYLAVWTSLNQDGSGPGIFGRYIPASGSPSKPEFQVNSQAQGPQQFPGVASDEKGRCLVVWSTFAGGDFSVDLAAQRFSLSEELLAPSHPFVSALSASALSVTWPELSGYKVDRFELFVDGNAVPVAVQGNIWKLSNLAPSSTHSFRLAYVLTDGRRSPISETTTGKTWGSDDNFDGLPDDWQQSIWGSDKSTWPPAGADSDGDGATNLQEFLAGTDALDPASCLRISITPSATGNRVVWNTQKGNVYQVQFSKDLKKWLDLGTPRFAPAQIDSIPASPEDGQTLYRVIRLR
jgi:hypothetical protein